MCHGNDRLSNLAVGAVVVIVFLLIGRLKRSLRKPPSETYRCGRCRRTLNLSSKSRVAPKAFTEKGLYMLATVLKSHRAVEATHAIIETYAEVRAMKRELLALGCRRVSN